MRCLASASLALCACAGEIDNKAQFYDRNTLCASWAQTYENVIKPSCATSGCHDAASSAQGLDLASADVGKRLLGKKSHCASSPLVGDDAVTGFLFDKLAAKPGCGSQMPLGKTALPPEQIDCIRAWVLGLAEPAAEEAAP